MPRIAIRSLCEGENPYVACHPAEDLGLKIEGGILNGKVDVQGIIAKSLPFLAFKGMISFRVDFECARCLRPFFREFRVPLRSRYEQVNEIRPGWEVALDVRYIPSSVQDLDILPEVREAIAFALPIVPLCRMDCPGLCPRCGGDLSSGACECKPMEQDTPWEALRKLKT
jgi:uncharacterized metal-binding protein YceD (DUF177 family)